MTTTQKFLIFATRVVFGLLFLEAGLRKLMGDFTASQYLLANTDGPFSGLFASMAGSNLVDFLVIFGEIGIGLALLFGVLVWFAAASGILMMILYYLPVFPPANGYITLHIIYIFVFLILWLFRAGEYWGLEERLGKVIKSIAGSISNGDNESEE